MKEKTSEVKNRPVALVTGGASFLGQAISRKLAREGFRVVLHYQNSIGKAKELAEELSALQGKTVPLRADLRKTAQAAWLAQRAVSGHGRLDLLVNNASLFCPTPLGRSKPAEWEDILRVNLFSPFALCQGAFAWLRKTKGSIVNLTDIYGEHPLLPDHAIYCASKAGLINLTKTLAREMGPEVRVNGVSPGAIFIPSRYSPAQRKRLIERSALKRQGTPEEVADAVHFMATHRFLTGQVLNVDGGRFL
jgi:pteridine reductase